jgi:hypothetical protein
MQKKKKAKSKSLKFCVCVAGTRKQDMHPYFWSEVKGNTVDKEG